MLNFPDSQSRLLLASLLHDEVPYLNKQQIPGTYEEAYEFYSAMAARCIAELTKGYEDQPGLFWDAWESWKGGVLCYELAAVLRQWANRLFPEFKDVAPGDGTAMACLTEFEMHVVVDATVAELRGPKHQIDPLVQAITVTLLG